MALSTFLAAAPGRFRGVKARSHAVTARAMRSAETAFGAFAVSALTTKLGGPSGKQLFGVPLSLGVAAVGYGLAAFDMGGNYNQDLANFADGALAAYAAGVGREAGQGRLTFSVGAQPNPRGYQELLGLHDTQRR